MDEFEYGDVVYIPDLDEYGTIIDAPTEETNYTATILLEDGSTTYQDIDDIEPEYRHQPDYSDCADSQNVIVHGKVDSISAILQTYGTK